MLKNYLFEEWRDIKDYEGFYQVSNFGRVKSLDRYIERNGKPALLKGKIIKQAYTGRGRDYLFVGLSKNGKVKLVNVHRLVAEAFIPNPDNLPQVNHKDENKSNNCVDNLEWCSALYNLTYNDRHIKAGLKERGKKSKFRKKVKVLRDNVWIATFFTPKDAGDYVGVTETSVRQNIYGRSHIVKGHYAFQYLDGSGKLTETELRKRKDRSNYLRRLSYARNKV